MAVNFLFLLGFYTLCVKPPRMSQRAYWWNNLCFPNTSLHVAEFHLALMGQENTSIISYFIFRYEGNTEIAQNWHKWLHSNFPYSKPGQNL